MPRVIVMADLEDEPAEVMRERVAEVDFESEHAASALIQRVGWAVQDAAALERDEADPGD